MNTSINNLIEDHKSIIELIQILESKKFLQNINKEELHLALYFLQLYADKFHHAKEENILFPFLKNFGFSEETGPVSVMLQEHKQGREYLSNLAQLLKYSPFNDNQNIESVKENIYGYCNLLRNHIKKEDNILFPMADKLINEFTDNKLFDRFKERMLKYEIEIEKSTSILNSLKEKYN